jgi:hypothetical protein
LNPQTGEIGLEVRGSSAIRIVVTTEKCDFRRYARESVKFADARPGSFGDLSVGDQLRALGERSADGKKLKAATIVSGSFRTIGAVVSEVNPQTNEIKAQTLEGKRAIVIGIGPDTAMHRLPQPLAASIAQRLLAGGGRPANVPAQGSPPPNAAGQPARPAPNATGQPASSSPDALRQPASADIQQMIDGLPRLPLAEIRVGDVIAVTSGAGAADSRVTAIKLVAGIDAVLKAITAPPGRRQVIPLSAGLPAAFDFAVVQ